jgi:hypothetical protein
MTHLWNKIVAAGGLLLFLAGDIRADIDPYTATVGPNFGYTATGSAAAYQSIAGRPGTLYLPLGGIADPEDDGWVTHALPFDFQFFGTTYGAGSNIHIGANGYVLFGTISITPQPTNLLVDGASFGNQPAIAPFFTDLIARGMQEGGPGIYAQTSGTPGNQRFTIEWSALQDFNNMEPSSVVSFSVSLLEGSNSIVFHYDSTLFGTAADNGRTATVGIRDTTFATPPDNVLQWGFMANTPEGVGIGLGDSDFQITFSFSGSSVPEPAALFLCSAGGLGMGIVYWRRRRTRRLAG